MNSSNDTEITELKLNSGLQANFFFIFRNVSDYRHKSKNICRNKSENPHFISFFDSMPRAVPTRAPRGTRVLKLTPASPPPYQSKNLSYPKKS